MIFPVSFRLFATGQINPPIAITGSARIEDIEAKEIPKKKMKKIPLLVNPDVQPLKINGWYWIVFSDRYFNHCKQLRQCSDVNKTKTGEVGVFQTDEYGPQMINAIHCFPYTGKMRMKYYLFGEEIPLI